MEESSEVIRRKPRSNALMRMFKKSVGAVPGYAIPIIRLVIDIGSSPEEVQVWLQSKRFNAEFQRIFNEYNGEDMFDLSNSTKPAGVAVNEFVRLLSALNAIKPTTSGSKSAPASTCRSSMRTDPATKLHDAVTRVIKCFEKGNDDDQGFARTLAMKAHKIKSIKLRFAAGLVLGMVHSKSNATTRKRIRENFENIVKDTKKYNELKSQQISTWQQFYSINVDSNKSSSPCVSFNSKDEVFTFEVS